MTTVVDKELWEILVPTRHPNGDEINVDFHQQWDEKVNKIAGGLTLFPTVRGAWGGIDDRLIYEEMIPVRIACDRYKLPEIMAMTMGYYEQEAIIVNQVSPLVFIMEK